MCKLLYALNEISKELENESEKINKISSSFCEYDGKMFNIQKYRLEFDTKKGIYVYKGETNEEDGVSKSGGIYIFWDNGQDEVVIPNKFDKVHYAAKLNKGSNTYSNHCLYVGSSYNIYGRIKEHLSEQGKKTPYSLKCSHKNRKDLIKNTKIYVFKLNDKYEPYKDILLSRIESQLHKN